MSMNITWNYYNYYFKRLNILIVVYLHIDPTDLQDDIRKTYPLY